MKNCEREYEAGTKVSFQANEKKTFARRFESIQNKRRKKSFLLFFHAEE